MDAKAAAQKTVEQLRNSLVSMSHRIHANPELGYEEEKASVWLSEALVEGGFAVELGVCELPTAFRAKAGNGPLHLVICAEYDSLPAIGHACGHNVIAASALGAGLALAPIADDLGITVTVMGTPAEEVGDAGGKIVLLERGAFEGQHAAMMVHPAPLDILKPRIIAASTFEVSYTGRAAHAAAFPEMGVNALDAMTVAQVAMGLLRQHIRQSDRFHGYITKGGDAPNVIPEHVTGKFMARAEHLDDLLEVQERVVRCFEAGALATGAELKVSGARKPYAHMVHDHDLSSLYRRNAEALGRSFPDVDPRRFTVSTDMGNVSLAIPSIHPAIGIASGAAGNHQPEFAAFCARPAADQSVVDGALAMAWTAIDISGDAELRERLRAVVS